MSYKQYMRSTRKFKEEALVTLGTSDNIYLNTFIMRKYLNGVKFVILLFDDQKKSFALKPIEDKKEGAYSLGFSSRKNKSTGYVAARGFVNLPLIKKSKGKTFKATWNEKDQMLEINLA